MKVVLLPVAFALLWAGCQRKPEPLLAYGKPVDHWLQELKKPNPKARKKAVAALGHVGTADPSALPAVLAALKGRDAGVRDEAVLTLVNIGAHAKDTLPALTQALNQKAATLPKHTPRPSKPI